MSPDDYIRLRGKSPAAPAKPSRSRASLATRNAARSLFKGAQSGNDSWSKHPVTPDAIIAQQHTALVARSREQWANNDYVRAFIRLNRQNVVGPVGVTMQAKAASAAGKLNKPLNDALEADFIEWGRKGNCDVTGKLSWREIQCLAIETAARDGEFIARKVYGPDAGLHGFALQLIDPLRLPAWRNEPRLRSGGFIRHGIEFNAWGKPVAYHFTDDNAAAGEYYSTAGRGFVRVPAEEIIHEFLTEMVGLRRGLPWASSALFRLRNVNGFEDAAVQNARAGAAKMGFIKYAEGFGPEADEDEPIEIEATPMGFHELPMGADIAEWTPQFPSADAAEFLKGQLRGAASGMGVPYNELANDLEGVNFSSIRQATLDAREHYKELQEWLIEALIAPVREAHLMWRVLNGKIVAKGRTVTAAQLPACRAVSWQARRWQWIDPSKDAEAALAAIRGGLTSPSQVIREQGRDPEAVFTEIARDMAAMKSAGIPDEIIDFFFKGSAAGNVKAPPATKPSEGPAE